MEQDNKDKNNGNKRTLAKKKLPKGIRLRPSGRYEASYFKNGKRLTRTVDTLEEAKDALILMKAELVNYKGSDEPQPPLSPIIPATTTKQRTAEEFVWTLRYALNEINKAPKPAGWKDIKDIKTTNARIYDAMEFFGQERKINDISTKDILEYVQHCSSVKENSNATLNRKMCALRKLLKFSALYGKGLSEHDMPKFPAKFKESPKRNRVYTDEELTALAREFVNPETFPQLTEKKRRETQCMFIVLVDTGARFSEITTLEAEDIDFEREEMTLKGERTEDGTRAGTKNDKFRTIPLTPEAIEALKECTENGTKKPFQITHKRFYGRLKRAQAAIGIPKEARLGIHDIRHTAATALSTLVPLQDVMEHLGHSNITTTQRYLKPNMNRTRDALKLLREERIKSETSEEN